MNKAQVAEVFIGLISIKGLMLEDGSFAVGVPQICEQFNIPQKNAVRDFKSLLGESFTFLKVKIENSRVTMNTISLLDYERLVAKLDRKGNFFAQQFRDDLVGLSLQQLFCDAFGQKFDLEERQQWLKIRQEGKITRRHLTDAVADYIKLHNITGNKATFYYKQVTDKIYEGLTGIKTTKKLREKLDVPEKQTPRDYVSDHDLLHIQEVEDTVQRYIDSEDQEPLEAVDQVIRALLLKDSGLTRKLKL
jgi:hypothetical protein